MPDYNLGRAHGEIEITADTRGAQEAQAAMASTKAEAAALDAEMGKVNTQFDKNRQSSILSAEALVRQRGQVEELRKTYERYNQDYERASTRKLDTERKLQEARRREQTEGETLLRLGRDVQRSRENEQRLLLRSQEAYERYQTRLSALRLEVERFNTAHIAATTGFSNMRNEAEKAGQALEKLSDKLTGIAKVMTNIGVYGLFGTGAAGALGIMGGGGLHELTIVAGAALEVMKDFAGAMLLLPAGISAAAVSLGTLAAGFHGVAQAIGSIGDPAKFIESLRELSPAAREFVISIERFSYAIRGAREMVQESLFQPLIADIQPLVYTWLPLLMQAGQRLASEFGQSFRQVFQFLLQPETQTAFQTFTNNLVHGFQAVRGAIQPFMEMMRTLTTVGSQIFVRIGQAIAHIANEFNNWVQNAAQSGRLLQIMNQVLDDFTRLAHIIRDLGIGLSNFFDIAERTGGGFLQQLERIAATFRQWTESARGQAGILNFFNLLNQSAEEARPLIHLLGQGISIIASTLDRLGLAIQPGLVSFFTSFVEALRVLSPAVQAMAPALNEFLADFGKTLLQIVQELGPRLPQFFKDFADALSELMYLLPGVAHFIGVLFGLLSPHEIEVILGLVAAIKLLNIALGVMDVLMDANPIGIVIVAIGLLIAGIVLLVTHWDTVKQKIGEVTEKFGGLHGLIDDVKRAWDSLTNTVSNWWNILTNAISSGWDSLVGAFVDLKNKIVHWFDDIDLLQIGKNLIKSLADGILAAIPTTLKDALKAAANSIKNFWNTGSPAQEGPLHDTSPDQMGENLSTNYAYGISSGTGAVSDASSQVASGAARGLSGSAAGGAGGAPGGTGGGTYTSAGNVGISGRGQVSGFDQYIAFITSDMQAWLKIAQDGWSLFQNITKIVTDTTRVIADLWNRGDNPLTRPGELYGPPLPTGQIQVPGVPGAAIPGVPPDAWAKNLPGALPGAQQAPPGVPLVGPRGVPLGGALPAAPTPGQPGFIGPVAPTRPPAPAAPAAPAPAAPAQPAGPAGAPAQLAPGGGLNARQADIANRIINEGRRRGASNDQINAALAIAADESNLGANDQFNTSGGNASVGGVGGIYQQAPGAGWGTKEQVMDPNYSIPKFWDAFSKHPQYASNPMVAAVLTQNPQIGPSPQGTEYWNAVQRATQQGPYRTAAAGVPAAGGVAPTDVTQPQPIGPIPGAAVNPATQARFPLQGTTTFAMEQARKAGTFTNPPLYPPGLDTGGYAGPGVGKLPPWVVQFAARFGLVPSTYADGGTLHQSGYAFDFAAPAGTDPEVAAQRMDAFSEFIKTVLPGQTMELIHQNERTGQQWRIAGGQVVGPGTQYQNYFDAEMGEHGDYGTGPHVHWATDVPPILPGITAPLPAPAPPAPPQEIAPIPRLPAGPRDRLSGLRLPGALGGWGPIGIGAGLIGAGGLGLARAAGGMRTRYLQATYDMYDARAKLDVIRSLSPEEIAQAGLTNPDMITFTEGEQQALRGLNIDLSGPPPGEVPAPEAASVVGDVGAEAATGSRLLRGLGVAGRVAGPALTAVAALPWAWGAAQNIAGPRPARVQGVAGIDDILSGRLGVGNILTGPITGPLTADDRARLAAQGAGPPPITPTDLSKIPQSTIDLAARSGHPIPGTTPSYAAGGAPGIPITPQNLPGLLGLPGAPPSNIPQQPAGPRPPLPGYNFYKDWYGAGQPSTPVTVTNPQEFPGGQRSPGGPTPPAAGPGRVPRPGEPGFIGPVANAPAQIQGDTHQGTGAPPGPADYKGWYGGTQNAVGNFDTRSPMQQFTDSMSGVGKIIGDAFKIFEDVIDNIRAAAAIGDTLVRGVENTEDIVHVIQNVQSFIKTAGDIAQTVGDTAGAIAQMIPSTGGADFGGSAAAQSALQAVSAIASIVSAAIQATNEAISLGIEVYHEVGKYAGFIFGSVLGGALGTLGGNVRMLLNTRTGEIYTYSEDNPLNKNTIRTPFAGAYTQPPAIQNQNNQMNIYTGPGQSPMQMMQNTMWMVSTGAPQVASVAAGGD